MVAASTGVFLAAALACVARALLLSGSERRAWLTIGAGLSSWAGGYLYWALFLRGASSVPFPSVADFLWLGLYPLLYLGVVQLGAAQRKGERHGIAIDGALGALAIAAFAAALLVTPVRDATGGDLSVVGTTIAYPLADLHMLAFIGALWFLRGRRAGPLWPLLAALMAVLALADVFYLFRLASGEYAFGTALEVAWGGVAIGIAAAAWLPSSGGRRARVRSSVSVGVPAILTMSAAGLLAYAAFAGVERAAAGLALATLCLAALRTAYIARQLERTREAARWSDEVYRTLVESTSEGVWVVDCEDRITFLNARMAAMLGEPVEAIIGAPVDRYLVDGRRAQQSERTLRRGDGGEVEVLLSSAPLTDTAGDRAGSMVLAVDITRRKKMEKALQDLLHDREMMLNAAGDGIFRVDLSGTLLYVNPAGGALLGYDSQELVGRPAHRTFHHSHADGSPYPVAECPVLSTLDSGEIMHVDEESFWRKDGTRLPVEYTTAPVRDDGAVTGCVVVFKDVTERSEMQSRLRHQAEHDPLTGLYNRRRFQQVVRTGISHAARTGRTGAVLLADLDHFKFVNDSLGHTAGDEVLRKIAEMFSGRLRDTDVLARLGGDEFAAFLPGASSEDALGVARDLIRLLQEACVKPTLGVSIGVAMVDGDLPGATDDILVAADIALYEAKGAGRGVAKLYTGGKSSGLASVEQIRAAIDSDRLVLHAQPIVDLRSGELAREELLVRMLDEDGDLISPASFLPAAEQFGMIGQLDRWVLERALELAREGRRLAVNLSARSLSDTRLTEALAVAVEGGVDPTNLLFEITETAAIAHLDPAREFADRLTALGSSVALDDFGTGFGSFTYLKHMPVRYLKIDMDFVRGLPRSSTDQRMVKAIVGIARSLGQKTMAEGVEDLATLELLRRYGVDYAQGYYIARPAQVDPEHPAELSPGVRQLYDALSRPVPVA